MTTFNIRTSDISEDYEERTWSHRRAGVYSWINTNQPAILCAQEVMSDQRSDILGNCPGYAAVYDGSSISWIDEHLYNLSNADVATFYKTSEVSIQSSGVFFLVDGAPASPARSSEQNNVRACAWMKCTYKGQKMLVLNAHLSYRTKNNSEVGSDDVIALRQTEMGVIETWIDEHYTPSTDGFLLFMGDMNTSHWEAIFDVWKDGTYGYFARATAETTATGRTYNHWDSDPDKMGTIDYQFYKGFPSVKTYSIDTGTYAGVEYLSDHWPVTAEYRLPF